MYLVEVKTGQKLPVVIEKMTEQDYEFITEQRFWFDWKAEKQYHVYKLTLKDNSDILGIVSIEYFDIEERIEVRLLAVAQEHKGAEKLIDGITGNLLAYVCSLSLNKYGLLAAISLLPKTMLKQHYKSKYGFIQLGIRLMLSDNDLFKLILKYGYDR